MSARFNRSRATPLRQADEMQRQSLIAGVEFEVELRGRGKARLRSDTVSDVHGAGFAADLDLTIE